MEGLNSYPARNQRENRKSEWAIKPPEVTLVTHFLQQAGSVPKFLNIPYTGESVQIPRAGGSSKQLNPRGVRWSREQRLLLRGLEKESTEEVKLGLGSCNSASGLVITSIICQWKREGKGSSTAMPGSSGTEACHSGSLPDPPQPILLAHVLVRRKSRV